MPLFKGNNSKISTKRIEEALGMRFPIELEKLYENHTIINQQEYIFNISHLTNNWIFSDCNFWLLLSDSNSISNLDIYKKEYTNQISIINASKEISSQLNEPVLCFAWSHDCIEKDTGLFFRQDGKIYGFSGNFSEEGQAVLITPKLHDLFDTGSANRILEISEILQSNQWYYGDQECVDTANDYLEVINDYFIKTSQNQLKLNNFQAAEKDLDNRELKLKINDKDFSCLLNSYNGWIDPLIVNFMNKILNDLNIIDMQFVEIRDSSWGQEMGVAFASEEQILRLDQFGYLINQKGGNNN